MRAFSRLMSRFRRDQRGNIAVIFAIACIPVISAVGCGIDYSEASRMRAKLQSAADAAAVASISQNSQGWVAASQMSGNGPVTTAQTDAMNIFLGNINNVYNPGNNNPGANLFTLNIGSAPLTSASVTKTGVSLTSTVTFSANVPTIFMNIVGFPQLTVKGSSSASSSLPMYLDFYVMLDVSGSMGLPSTNAEQTRLAAVNPDDFTVYPAGCTFACHFQSSGSCTAPPTGQKVNPTGVTSPIYSAYPTNGYCLGYLITRVSQSGYQALLNSAVTSQTKTNYPMKSGQVLPSAMLSKVTSNVSGGLNSLLTGNANSMSNSLTAVSSCPTEGTDACIQLRADAVGTALNATVASQGVDGLFAVANKSEVVNSQFRIGLYPFIQNLYKYFDPPTSTIGAGSAIQTAAQNLATLLDTGNSPNLGLGSGGTHFENAFPQMNAIIPPSGGGTVGTGSSPTNTKPFVFLVTDGAQNFQTCCNFSGSNSATVMASGTSSPCKPLRDRGITVAVLYIPYEPIQNPTTIFNNEDNVANANIANIPASLQSCASPNFFFQATSTSQIAAALAAMFNQALVTAHLTN